MSPLAAANFSSMTTDFAPVRTRTQKLRRPRAVLPPGCRAPGSVRATKLSSGARTGPSGLSRCGDVCSTDRLPCRSITARRRTSSRRSSTIVGAKLILLGDDIVLDKTGSGVPIRSCLETERDRLARARRVGIHSPSRSRETTRSRLFSPRARPPSPKASC